MELVVKHLENVKFAVQARGHEVVCDQPRITPAPIPG